MFMETILTVTQLTEAIKQTLEGGFGIVWVTGEVSNLRRPASGHVYATLKDETSQIRVVVFRSAAVRMGFDLEDGMEIVCKGRVNVYPARGEYQLIVDTAEPKGLGALQMAFEQLKGRLEKEGLFDPSHKRSIPFLPATIGVVTSPSGAAVRDILNITGRRFPSVDIVIAPAAVQGAEAPREICSAIADLNTIGVDVIILARGGGSLEDLFCFNDEGVARAIWASRIPVISAVGHEIDFTIADFVADLRAPTPSAAAELVVPDRRDLLERVRRLRSRLMHVCDMMLRELKTRLIFITEGLRDPKRRLADLHLKVADLRRGLESRTRSRIDALRRTLQREIALLDTLSPLAVLQRGFGVVRLPGGTVVRDAGMLAVGDSVDVRVASGSFTAQVTTISQEHSDGRKKV
ncbi:MAG: exodeoxyribonuclease VII large subunit [Deltaproteobacteria bacterium]|nr:exodeoxyribonuclease VII large subunit [Deltaproteobacteria bacterium]